MTSRDFKKDPQHDEEEISRERNKCSKKFLATTEERRKVALEYAGISSKSNNFNSFTSIEDSGYCILSLGG